MDKKSTYSGFPLSKLYQNEVEWADQVYLRQPVNRQWHEYTWQQTMDQARRVAHFLQQQGCQKGDRVAILSKNCAEWFMIDFGIMMAGCVSVPLYATQKAQDITYILQHAEAKLIFVGKLDHAASQESGIPDGVLRVGMPYGNPMRVDFTWDQVQNDYLPLSGHPLPNPDDVLTIIYTSGTTGTPKGVVYTYAGLDKMREYNEQDFNAFGLERENHFISYLPLAHVVERIAIEMTSIGLPGYQFDVSFVESLDTFKDDLASISPTLFFAVPRIWTIFQMGVLEKVPEHKLNLLLRIPGISWLLKRKIRKTLGFSRCRLFVSGAAPIAKSTLEFFHQLGIPVVEGYGQTENMAYVTINRGEHVRLGTTGRARMGVDLKVGDNHELLVRSPGNMWGYYKDEELTRKTFTEDGYLKSGDMVRLDDEGYLTIIGRVKEQFKTAKGEYISPVPIEGQFCKNTNIEQCCLVGAGLRQPVLVAMLSANARHADKSTLEKNLQDFISLNNEQLATHERVSHILLVNEEWTPENGLLTPTQKVRRAEVEQHYDNLIALSQKTDQPVIWEDAA